MGQEDLGVYHISADPTNYEVCRNNFFTLVITDLHGITSVDYVDMNFYLEVIVKDVVNLQDI